jgi:hypothetical protein
MVLVGSIDLFVLGLVGRIHIPVETISQSRRAVFIFYALELLLASA